MLRHVLIFTVAFLAGAVVVLIIRAASHEPHALPETAAQPGSVQALAPTSKAVVNTVCSLCGMDVDSAIPTATYQGKTIGFGCRACPPRFAADPDRYGPAALKNQVVE